MRTAWWTALAVLLLAGASACGSSSTDPVARAETSPSDYLCVTFAGSTIDLDVAGGGARGSAELDPGTAGRCPPTVSVDASNIDGKTVHAVSVDDLPTAKHGFRAVTVPGRTGQLVLLVQTQPRGGFQAHLYGYADKKFAELKVDGKPVFPFVSTDTGSSHLAAHCVAGGFDVETAAHSSKRTWNVSRTVYQVAGNTVTAGETSLVGQDVSDLAFQHTYGDVASDELFADCT